MKRILVLASALALSGCISINPDTPLFGADPNLAEAMAWPSHGKLVVEMHHVTDRAPSAYTLQRISEVLHELTDKQQVVMLDSKEVPWPSDPNRDWTFDDFTAFHRDTYSWAAGEYLRGDEARFHMMFLDGIILDDNGEPWAVGIQAGPRLGIWADPVREVLLNFGGADIGGLRGVPNIAFDQAEAAIAVHDIGHALGLVDREAPMLTPRLPDKEADPCQCHSNNRDSVMYPGTEKFNAQRYVEEQRWVVDDFDADDRADLAALRDRY